MMLATSEPGDDLTDSARKMAAMKKAILEGDNAPSGVQKAMADVHKAAEARSSRSNSTRPKRT